MKQLTFTKLKPVKFNERFVSAVLWYRKNKQWQEQKELKLRTAIKHALQPK